MEKFIKPSIYAKHHSFQDFRSSKQGIVNYQLQRARRLGAEWKVGASLEHASVSKKNFRDVVTAALADLDNTPDETLFHITPFIAEEMATYSDDQIVPFLYHRYRYDMFPGKRILDDYPPYLQIEPSSLCNFRCVFCYQTDQDFFKKASGDMGFMSLETYKRIVDLAVGNIEFLSLASRGEPTLTRDLSEMLAYSAGKFLNLKLNTNASLLTEPLIHTMLSGGVRTVVFSADAAAEPLYSQLRVNGKLDIVRRNIEKFATIREREYPDARIITRVSGVKVSDSQDIRDMETHWGGLVEQVTFVNYNPWENVYSSDANNITQPCSDLWRRLFVWQDGQTNPCDTDYRSTLGMGHFSDGLSEIWGSDRYTKLREAHTNSARHVVEPCRRCSVV